MFSNSNTMLLYLSELVSKLDTSLVGSAAFSVGTNGASSFPSSSSFQFRLRKKGCVLREAKSDWHVDKMNIGYSAIMCFGDFVHGGEFVLRGEDGEDVKYDVRNKVMIIDGKKPHSSTPFAGNEHELAWRVSGVFFCHSHHSSCQDRSFLEDELGFLFPPSKGVMDQIADAEPEQIEVHITDAELEQIEAALIEVHIADAELEQIEAGNK